MNLKATPLQQLGRSPRKRGGPRRTREGSFVFAAPPSSTFPSTVHRRIATAGDATPLTTGPRIVFGQVLVRQIDGAANALSRAVAMKSTAPSMSCARLVARGVLLVSSRPINARTLHQRRRVTTLMLTSMISSTPKHSRESGHWEGLMS